MKENMSKIRADVHSSIHHLVTHEIKNYSLCLIDEKTEAERLSNSARVT